MNPFSLALLIPSGAWSQHSKFYRVRDVSTLVALHNHRQLDGNDLTTLSEGIFQNLEALEVL